MVEDLEEGGEVAVGDWGDCGGEGCGGTDDFEGGLGDVDAAVGAGEGSAAAHGVGEDLGEGFGGSGAGSGCRGSGCLHSVVGFGVIDRETAVISVDRQIPRTFYPVEQKL